MRKVGKVVSYDGRFGTIADEQKNLLDFERKNISLDEVVKSGDAVEYRKEMRPEGVLLARNVKVLMKTRNKERT